MRPLFQEVVLIRVTYPADHSSFVSQGGSVVPHCIGGSEGAEFHAEASIAMAPHVVEVTLPRESVEMNGFEKTGFGDWLKRRRIKRLVLAGLGIETQLSASALGALSLGFDTWLALDASASLERGGGERERALATLFQNGVSFTDSGQIATIMRHHHRPTALVLAGLQNDYFPGGQAPIPGALAAIGPIRTLLELAGATLS